MLQADRKIARHCHMTFPFDDTTRSVLNIFSPQYENALKEQLSKIILKTSVLTLCLLVCKHNIWFPQFRIRQLKHLNPIIQRWVPLQPIIVPRYVQKSSGIENLVFFILDRTRTTGRTFSYQVTGYQANDHIEEIAKVDICGNLMFLRWSNMLFIVIHKMPVELCLQSRGFHNPYQIKTER